MSAHLDYPTSPYDHQPEWGCLPKVFCRIKPSGCVNPENTNERTRKDNRSQCNSRRSDVSPS
jgi:hypothetical protein